MKRVKAVALSYPEAAAAPFITASGAGDAARRILDIARENDVEIVENGELVDILSVYDIGMCIPPETYEAVAGIFAFLKRFGGADAKSRM